MSDIDQAFIHAYHDQDVQPATIPLQTLAVQASRQAAPEQVESVSSVLRVDEAEPTRTASPPRFAGPPAAIHSRISASVSEIGSTPSEEEVILPSTRERRPLSAFAKSAPPAASFTPAYEVDGFRWPEVVDTLIRQASELFHPVVDRLVVAAQEGHTLVGIAGSHSRVGTTTVTLCLAKELAAAGKKVALVDANFSQGVLQTQLGLEFELGWDGVLAGKLPLTECAVKSLAQSLTLIPLSGPVENSETLLDSIHTAVTAGMLRYHHDLVLFDLGTGSEQRQLAIMQKLVHHCRLDLNLIVAPPGVNNPTDDTDIARLSELFQSTCLGIVGNRVG